MELGGNGRGVAQGERCALGAVSHASHDHQAHVNPYAHRQPHAPVALQAVGELCYALDHPQRRMHRTPCIIFVRPRVSKIHHQFITLVLGDMPVKPVHDLGTHGVIVTHHLVQHFGVQGLGALCNADKPTRQHRQLAPFDFGQVVLGGAWGTRRALRW